MTYTDGHPWHRCPERPGHADSDRGPGQPGCGRPPSSRALSVGAGCAAVAGIASVTRRDGQRTVGRSVGMHGVPEPAGCGGEPASPDWPHSPAHQLGDREAAGRAPARSFMTSTTFTSCRARCGRPSTTRSDKQDLCRRHARPDRIRPSQAQQDDRLERIDGRLDQILTLLRRLAIASLARPGTPEQDRRGRWTMIGAEGPLPAAG